MRPFAALLFVTTLSLGLAQAQDIETESETEQPEILAPTPPADAFLLVTVNVPGANIVVDESQTMAAPAAALRLPPGTHTIQVSAEGYRTFEQSIQVPSEGARVDVFLDPSLALAARFVASEDGYESNDSSGVHKKWWFWAAVGGGVVVVAVVIAAIALAGGGDVGQDVIPIPPIPGGP